MDLPPLIFGAMAHHGAGDDDARVALMRDAADAGYRAFDTAPLYGFGASEEQLGRALRGRDDVLVLTKVGLTWDGTHGEVLFATPTHTVRKDSRPESVLREIDRSLERLGRARIDLIQVHHPDVRVPFDETFGALREAHTEGKVGAIGVSNFRPTQLRAAATALGEIPLFSAQDHYSLLHREPEAALLPACRALECAFLAFSPLAQGVLAGAMMSGRRLDPTDWRSGDAKYRERNLSAIHAAMEASLRPAAARRGATLSQIALAWTIGEPDVTSAIAGARTIEQARANLGAASIVLESDERRVIRRAFEAVRIDARIGRRERARRLVGRAVRKARRLLGRGP